MKILLLACLVKNKSGNSYGGAEKSIVNLANWLSDEGYNVTLASVEGKEKAFFINENVNFRGYNIQAGKRLYVHYQMYKNTQDVINKVKPDVIIGFWIHPMFYCLFNKFARRAVKIYSERNDPKLEYGCISKVLRWFVVRYSNGIVFQTEMAQKYFGKKIQRKSRVIHNPVYISKAQYPIKKERDNRIVAVGRLNPQKNFELLINAFNKVVDDCPNSVLEIYGEGPLHKSLQNQIDLLNLTEKVFLMGAHANVLDRICGARLFVMTSIYEGMPNALMEAMCLGIPVLSSDCPCGGPGELIDNGINGYLFKIGDIETLAEKIRYIYNKSDMESIISNEQKICITHSTSSIFPKWIEYIKELLKEGGN